MGSKKTLATKADDYMRSTFKASGFTNPDTIKDDPFQKFMKYHNKVNKSIFFDSDGNGKSDF